MFMELWERTNLGTYYPSLDVRWNEEQMDVLWVVLLDSLQAY